MSNQMNTSVFSKIQQDYFSEFEKILSKITICYQLMIDNGTSLPNDENLIRDRILHDYLNNNEIRRKHSLTDFLFDKEVPEKNTNGRTDIKIQTKNTFIDTSAYYIIECKRLNNKAKKGTSGLNAKYITNGIYRFVNNKYSSHYKTNAMLGFVVSPMDIHSNTNDINELLSTKYQEANMVSEISKESFIPNFKYQYISKHLMKNGTSLKLYHLMYDYSSLIYN